MNTGIMPVFEEKFKKLVKKIEREYEKSKSERDKDFLKRTSREARDLRKILKECRKQMGSVCCPHCRGEVNVYDIIENT